MYNYSDIMMKINIILIRELLWIKQALQIA